MGQETGSSGPESAPSYSYLKVHLGTDLSAHSSGAGWDSIPVPWEMISGCLSLTGYNGIATGLLPTMQL